MVDIFDHALFYSRSTPRKVISKFWSDAKAFTVDIWSIRSKGRFRSQLLYHVYYGATLDATAEPVIQ